MDHRECGVGEPSETSKRSLGDSSLSKHLENADLQETASYVAALLVEVRILAAAKDMDFLVYLIEMAFMEAYARAEEASPDEP